MKLEQQVSSLELSKTLKNLGVRQESAFYWDNIISKDMDETEAALWTKGECIHGAEFYEGPSDHAFAAFTVAELYKIHCDLDPHACYRFPEGIEPEHLADHLAEEICQLLKK